MKKTKTPQTPQLQEPDTQSKRRLSLPKVAYSAFLCVMMSMIFCQPAYAATDVWTKAKEIMQDVYTQILAISTIAAIVTASVALLLMNFSRSGRTVDEKPRLAQTNLYHLGYPQWLGLYHGVCDAAL